MKKSIYILLTSLIIIPLLSIVGFTGISKGLVGGLSWIAILLAWISCKNNDYSQYKSYYRAIILFILIVGAYQLIRCIPQGEYMTLFGNPSISLWLLLPIFGLCNNGQFYLIDIKKSLFVICFFIIFIYIINGAVEGLLSSFVLFAPFLLYISSKKYEKILIFVGLVIAFLWSTSSLGQRYVFAMLLQSIVMILICNVCNNKKIVSSYSIINILLPIIAIVIGFVSDLSIFQLMSNNVEGENGADTRSFLYFEVFSDMLSDNSLFFGRGSLGRYFSDFFYYSSSLDGDHYERIAVEIGALMYILKGGLLLLFLYMFLVIRTIYFLLRYGNNRLCSIFAAILSSHICMMFIYEVPILEFKYVFYYIIISLGNNNNFLNLSDNELVVFYENRNYSRF